jgi:cytochrome b6-f complex iron-sulfur subunit
MERQEFLSKLGIGLATVCTGCFVASCGSSKSGDPKPNPPGGGGGGGGGGGNGNLFTANLTNEITTVGSAKVSNGVILARIAAGNAVASFTAVQVACTHEGTSIAYNNTQGKFICPNHGSQFGKDGAVLMGPATTALKAYTIKIDGNTLTVSS